MQRHLLSQLRLVTVCVACVYVTSLRLSAQSTHAQTHVASCTTEKQGVTCDKAAFQKLLTDARTASLDTQPADRMAMGQLTRTIGKLGKTIGPSGSATDVSLLLTKINTGGIMIGPAGAALATLNVYGSGAAGHHGDLIWSETFTGQPDMSWPAIVHALLQQFQGSLGQRS